MIHALLLAAAIADAQTLFRQERSAVGGAAWTRIAEIVERGTVRGQGLTSRYISYTDIRTGHSKNSSIVAGTLQAYGLDAQGEWSQQETLVEPLNDAMAIASSKSAAYIARNGWWNPQHDLATFSIPTQKREGGKTYDVVHVVPGGGDPIDVWLDSSTHLIAKSCRRTSHAFRQRRPTVNIAKLAAFYIHSRRRLEQVTQPTIKSRMSTACNFGQRSSLQISSGRKIGRPVRFRAAR